MITTIILCIIAYLTVGFMVVVGLAVAGILETYQNDYLEALVIAIWPIILAIIILFVLGELAVGLGTWMRPKPEPYRPTFNFPTVPTQRGYAGDRNVES